MLLLLAAQPAAGRDLCVQLYSHTQVSGTLHIWASNFVIIKIIGFWKFLPQNPKIFRLRTEGLFIGPSKKIKGFGAIFSSSKSLWKVKIEVMRKFRYWFSQNWQQLYGNLSTHCFNWDKRMGVHSPGSCTTSYKYVNIFVLNYWL